MFVPTEPVRAQERQHLLEALDKQVRLQDCDASVRHAMDVSFDTRLDEDDSRHITMAEPVLHLLGEAFGNLG